MDRGAEGRRPAANAADFYRMLQVDPDAPHELIVEAYWHLVKDLQGDRKNTPGLRDRLDALNEAYATLISPERRNVYDATLPRVTMLRRQRARAALTAGRRSPVSLLTRRQRSHSARRWPDYYAVLGVDPSAEPAVINRARSLLGALHSDDVGHSEALAEAYDVLADPAHRAAYDAARLAATEDATTPAASAPSAAQMAPAPTAVQATASALETAPATPVEVAPGLGLIRSARDAPSPVLGTAAAAVRAAGRALWQGLAGGARQSRRFVVWAWPIVRERSSRFAAWAWPIVRRWSRWLAVHAWLATKALARAAARAIRAAARQTQAWWRERRASDEPIEDWTVYSRLSRGLDSDPSGSTRDGAKPARAMPRAAARLIVEAGPQTGVVLELEGEPVTLGAGEECALRLASDDGRVEAEHARIWRRQERFMIRQLAGQPCILVGGEAIPWAVLEDGDPIEIGAHVVRFRLQGQDTEP